MGLVRMGLKFNYRARSLYSTHAKPVKLTQCQIESFQYDISSQT